MAIFLHGSCGVNKPLGNLNLAQIVTGAPTLPNVDSFFKINYKGE